MPQQSEYQSFTALVETLNNRLQEDDQFLEDIGLVIVDEAHYNSFRKIFHYFENVNILGVTATPLSSNKKLPLYQTYKEIIVGESISALIGQGYLAEGLTYNNDVNLSTLRVGNNGEFTTGSHEMLYTQAIMQGKLLDTYEELALGTKTLIFNAGILTRFGLSTTVDLEAGILLTGRGAKTETYFNNTSNYVKTKFNPIYIEVPLNAVVKIPLAKGTALFFNAGPYAAIGLGGKSSSETKLGPLVTSTSNSIKFSNDDPFTSEQEDAQYDKLKRFDFGLNAGGGIEFKHLILKANYGFGLTKIKSTDSNNSANDKNKYRTVSFSVGIPLGKL